MFDLTVESEIQFDKMYKDALIYLITESDESTNNAGSAPSTTEKEMSKGSSKFRKFIDSVIDFISDIINKAQSYFTEFFTDKTIVLNIKRINDIVNKTGLKTSYQADIFGMTSPYANKMFISIDSSKLLELVEDYRMKMEHDKEHSVDIFKKI